MEKEKANNEKTLLAIMNYLSGLSFKERIQSFEITVHLDDGSSFHHSAENR